MEQRNLTLGLSAKVPFISNHTCVIIKIMHTHCSKFEKIKVYVEKSADNLMMLPCR